MPTEIFEVNNPFAVAFACDADLDWGELLEFPTTTRKVEGVGDKADFVSSKPLICTLRGITTAMTVAPAIPSPQKLVNEKSALQELAKKRQVVLVINDDFNGYLAITKVKTNRSNTDGKSFNADITFSEIEETVTGTANVPASKLRTKVKRKSASGKKGGAAKGSKPPSNGSLATKLVDGIAGAIGR